MSDTPQQPAAAAATASPTTGIRLAEHNRCGIITLDRPHVLNAINIEMVHHIHAALQRWEQQQRITGTGTAGTQRNKALVLLRSDVATVFSAGGDVLRLLQRPVTVSMRYFYDEYKLIYCIGTLRLPLVALIDGLTMGSGVGLSVHGAYRVATERTVFAMPEMALGGIPEAGSSFVLSRLRGQLGVYLALTASRLYGRDVWRAGIATHFCAAERLGALQRRLMECESGAEVEATLQRDCDAVEKPDDDEPATASAKLLHELQPLLDDCFGADTMEEIVGRLAQAQVLDGEPGAWATATLEQLRRMSPLSLKICLRMQRLGAILPLEECLALEWRLAMRFAREDFGEFREGIAAMLVRKDRAPKWRFARLEDVSEAVLDGYFEAPERYEDELWL